MENTIKDLEKAIELYNSRDLKEMVFVSNQINIAKNILERAELNVMYSIDCINVAIFCLNKDKLKAQLIRVNNKAFW
jgi:hypothetical protein